ncbi:ARM repeat-containing protein [Xylaria bambusicola]|uniref:ARM repeat-containing protein n=1 Tax=Xylaria bambusicola TaxID=326684 RepID=UPI002008A7E0|nr:ARM repeat-containing protein [Xylaria bambusicola]KAI0513161.1 ARM repeat-containing protein [Xylaria bambusicola]
MDDYRFRSQQSPRNEAPMNSLVSPQRNGRMPSQDPRSTLPRRFTTDSGRVPTLSSINTTQPQEYASVLPTQYKVQLLEKKKLEYEKLREQKRRFEAEMLKLDQQQRELREDLRPVLGLTGHQSEPTTPPEYRETHGGFPTMFSRPNRYSMSSLASPPGLFNRPGRSGSLLTSPQSSIMPPRYHDDPLPYRSVPATRRNSDEDEKEEALRQDPTSHRSTNALNRYSMPVTRRGNLYDNIDQTNTTGFLFRDDDATMESGNYPSVDANEDHFPQLHPQKGNPNVLSASTSAMDLASQRGSSEGGTTNGWGNITRHRQQQSLSTLPSSQVADSIGSVQVDNNPLAPRPFRHSIDLNQFRDSATESSPASTMPPATMPTPPKLQASFSANDVPTVKTMPGAATSSANAHAQQHFHNHNASIGRFPPGAMKRHSRELSGDNHTIVTQPGGTFPSIQSQLQGSAPSFGPMASSQAPVQSPVSTGMNTAASSPSGPPYPYYTGYNSPPGPNSAYNMLAMGMQNMNMNGYPQQNYTGYGAVYQPSVQPRDSQQRIMQQRRAQNEDGQNRFIGATLDQYGGTIYELCKDQHGCRFLQKQLENRNPEHVHMIWLETNQHVVELMTDPFGNYLCQKLLEYCNDEERTVLIQNAAKDMVRIALNQHGTRALQKMIEFVTTPTHVKIIIEALRDRVVELIQDLNGNHVIQKCLNKLASVDSQFIFTAVGNHCIEVGTHRHGCCVLQRCIDHASGEQKKWLISQISQHALRLVQDPFGNYVVQYIIDLNDPSFTEPLAQRFFGRVVELSRHKFSSNVIEKCLRCASEKTKDTMVREILASGELERLLKDGFGNYVIQTALDHSSVQLKHELVESIRPILPGIRGTPYGRRLAAKIQQHDNQNGNNSGQTTPSEPTQSQIVLNGNQHRAMTSQSILAPGVYNNGLNGTRAQMSYPTPANITMPNPPNPPPQPPRMNAYQAYPGAGNNHGNGDGAFF